MRGTGVDVARLIRIATVLFSAFAASLVVLQMEPAAGVATARLADDRDALASDGIAFTSLPHLERERRLLTLRYAHRPVNAGAQFLRSLAGIARRRGIHIVLTSFKGDAVHSGDAAGPDGRFFRSDDVTVTANGTYAHLLGAISDLSSGSQIVRVDAPNLTRDGDRVSAVIPVSILEPIGESS